MNSSANEILNYYRDYVSCNLQIYRLISAALGNLLIWIYKVIRQLDHIFERGFESFTFLEIEA